MVIATLIVVLGLLELVLKLMTEKGACKSTYDAVATSLVTAKVSSGASTKSTHQASVTLSLCVRISGAVAWLTCLRVCILSLGILVLWVGALLRELLARLSTRILSLLLTVLVVLAVIKSVKLRCTQYCMGSCNLPLLLIVWSYLSMLESAVSRCTVLLVMQ